MAKHGLLLSPMVPKELKIYFHVQLPPATIERLKTMAKDSGWTATNLTDLLLNYAMDHATVSTPPEPKMRQYARRARKKDRRR